MGTRFASGWRQTVALMAAGMVAVAASGCGGTTHAPRSPRMASAAPALAKPLPHRVRPPRPPVSAQLRRLRLTLMAALERVADPGAMVYDLTTGQMLFELDAGVARPPASVEKLYTSTALLTRLGPAASLRTRVLGVGHLGRRGVWLGSLYLRGGGDPTLGDGTFNRYWNGGYGPTAAQLSARLAARGIRRITGHVVGDPTLFDAAPGAPNTNFAPDLPDLGGELAGLTYDHGATLGGLSPGAFAARELVLTMRRAHIRARSATRTAATPAAAVSLAAVTSPPLLTLLKLMNVRSDDFFAEMLAKQLGVRVGSGGNTAAGAKVISAAIARYGLHPRIVDGSGLSRSDQSSPQQVVSLLRALWHTTVGRELDSTLPVVGVSGTTAQIGTDNRARGQCIAKTGTLDGVTNLAGYCHGADRHMLAFALFLDGPTLELARGLLSRMVGAMASY